ncbi:SCP2 sterol-binding domain-containing protein [bacterium]|nr:SCP2 sterol-binding domain-containing protein [bacterium]
MGKYITDIEQMYKGVTGLFASLDQLPDIKKKVLNTNLLLGLRYTDPEGQILVDATGDDIKVSVGTWPEGIKPEVELMMSADTSHLYWLGKVNFIMAAAKGEIRTSGNLGGVMKLVPVMKPLFKSYADFLKDNGMADLLI